jgi:hypothetical protein
MAKKIRDEKQVDKSGIPQDGREVEARPSVLETPRDTLASSERMHDRNSPREHETTQAQRCPK